MSWFVQRSRWISWSSEVCKDKSSRQDCASLQSTSKWPYYLLAGLHDLPKTFLRHSPRFISFYLSPFRVSSVLLQVAMRRQERWILCVILLAPATDRITAVRCRQPMLSVCVERLQGIISRWVIWNWKNLKPGRAGKNMKNRHLVSTFLDLQCNVFDSWRLDQLDPLDLDLDPRRTPWLSSWSTRLGPIPSRSVAAVAAVAWRGTGAGAAATRALRQRQWF